MIKNRHFPNRLKLDYAPDLGANFRLDDDFIYVTNNGVSVKCPRGMETDLASIPRGFRWLFKGHNRYTYGAIPHDYLYSQRGEFYTDDSLVRWGRKRCDDILYEACINAGVGKWRARMIYAAVRAGGWMVWRD